MVARRSTTYCPEPCPAKYECKYLIVQVSNVQSATGLEPLTAGSLQDSCDNIEKSPRKVYKKRGSLEQEGIGTPITKLSGHEVGISQVIVNNYTPVTFFSRNRFGGRLFGDIAMGSAFLRLVVLARICGQYVEIGNRARELNKVGHIVTCLNTSLAIQNMNAVGSTEELDCEEI